MQGRFGFHLILRGPGSIGRRRDSKEWSSVAALHFFPLGAERWGRINALIQDLRGACSNVIACLSTNEGWKKPTFVSGSRGDKYLRDLLGKEGKIIVYAWSRMNTVSMIEFYISREVHKFLCEIVMRNEIFQPEYNHSMQMAYHDTHILRRSGWMIDVVDLRCSCIS